MTLCFLCQCPDFVELFFKGSWSIVRCANCGQIRLNPLPDTRETLALYAAESGYLSQRLGDKTSYSRWENDRNDRFVEIVGPPSHKGALLLDVGCATGTFLVKARKQGWQVKGLELGEHTATFARSTYGLDVYVGNATDVLAIFGPEAFDVITLWDVIEHLCQPLEVLRDLLKVLKPGGRLYVATPNVDGWVPRFHFQTIRRLWGIWPHPEPPYHLYQFSHDTIKRALTTAGFSVTNFIYDEIPLWYTCGFYRDPGLIGWLRGGVHVPKGRWIYLWTLPVYLAAKIARRGDSMIVVSSRPV